MAVPTIKKGQLCLSDMVFSTPCPNPTIIWERVCDGMELPCGSGDCNCVPVEYLQEDDCKCFRAIVKCDGDCPTCGPYIIERCLCDDKNDCEGCEDCITGVCIPRCPDKSCVNDTCVDCSTENDCEGDKVCNQGTCQCPPTAPNDLGNGRCGECTSDAACKAKYGPCAKCVDNKCVVIDCQSGVCDPATGNCVECTAKAHCGTNECCENNQCVCCSGFERDSNGNCVPGKGCTYDWDCPNCYVCGPNGCEPRVCPTGYTCDPYSDQCKPICDCNEPTCSQTAACVDANTGNCFCNECSGSCSGDGDCGVGCVCDQTTKKCIPNPCGNSCSGSGDCGPGCGCYNGKCTPCSSLPCDVECGFAAGCGCIGDTCQDVKDKCDISKAGLKWTKVCPEGEVVNSGLSKLTPSSDISNCHVIKEGAAGDFYEGCTFSYSIAESVQGTWYYSPSADTKISIGSGTSASLTHNSGVLEDNIFGWRVIFETTDGRKVVFETVNLGGVQDADYNTTVASNQSPGATTSGGPCVYKLCTTSSNFTIPAWNPVNEKYTVVEGKQLQFNLKKKESTCLTFEITGCGTYQGQLPIECYGVQTLVDIPLFDNNTCCDLSKQSCNGGPGSCDGKVIDIPLIADAYFGGSGKNDFAVRADLSKIDFKTLYYLTNIKWSHIDGDCPDWDLDLDSSVDTVGQGSSKLYQNVSFKDCGCVALDGDAGCDTAHGETCLDKCTDFSIYLEDLGDNTYVVHTSHPNGEKVIYSITAGNSRVPSGLVPIAGNKVQFKVDPSVASTTDVVIKATYADTSCSDEVTIYTENECCLAVNITQEGDDSAVIKVTHPCGVMPLGELNATYSVGSTSGIIYEADWVPTGDGWTFTINNIPNSTLVTASVDRLGICGVTAQLLVEVCDLGLEVSYNEEQCRYDASVRTDLVCDCPTGTRLEVTRNTFTTGGGKVNIDFDWVFANLLNRSITSGKLKWRVLLNGAQILGQDEDITSSSGSIGFNFDILEPADVLIVKFWASEVLMNDNCMYNVAEMIYTFTGSDDDIPNASSVVTQKKDLAIKSGSVRRPEFVWKEGEDIVKRNYGFSSYLDGLDVKETYGVSATCGCTQEEANLQHCFNTTLSAQFTNCNYQLDYTIFSCFEDAVAIISMPGVSGFVNQQVTISGGLYTGSITFASPLDPNTSYDLVVDFTQAPYQCHFTFPLQTSSTFTPAYTTGGCSGGFWVITLPTNSYGVITSGTGTINGNLIEAIPDMSSISFTVTNSISGCVSDEYTETLDCSCTLESVYVPASFTVCENDTNVIITYSGLTPSGNVYEVRYDDGGGFSSWATATGSITVTNPGVDTTYDLEFRDQGGSTACLSKSTDVIVTATPVLTAGAVTCQGPVLSGGGQAWQAIIYSNVPITTNASQATVTNVGTQYTISNIPSSLYASILVSAGTGNCYVSYTFPRPDNCYNCTSTNTPTVNTSKVNPCSTTQTDGSVTVYTSGGCGGDIVTFDQSGITQSGTVTNKWIIPYSYENSTVTYTVTNNCGCGVTGSVNMGTSCSTDPCASTSMSIAFTGSFGAYGTGISKCPGDSFVINYAVTGGTAPYTYSWTRNTNSDLTSSSSTGTTTGTGSTTVTCNSNFNGGDYIKLKITDANGCTQSRTLNVNLGSCGSACTLPSTCNIIAYPSTVLGCGSSSVSLTACVTDLNYTYQWYGNGGFSSTSSSVTVYQAGTYNLTVTDPSAGCTISDTVTITNTVCCPGTCPECSGCSSAGTEGNCDVAQSGVSCTTGCCYNGVCIPVSLNVGSATASLGNGTVTISNLAIGGAAPTIYSVTVAGTILGGVYNGQLKSSSATIASQTASSVTVNIPSIFIWNGILAVPSLSFNIVVRDACGKSTSDYAYLSVGMLNPNGLGTNTCTQGGTANCGGNSVTITVYNYSTGTVLTSGSGTGAISITVPSTGGPTLWATSCSSYGMAVAAAYSAAYTCS